MLACRPTVRPANIVRRFIQGQTRSLHVTLPRAQIQPRPEGVLAKLRFRVDGTPRSRWVGAVVGTLVLTNALTLLAMSDFIEESEDALGVLASIVYMHKLDLQYDQVNFNDKGETYAYFKRMYQAFSQLDDEEIDSLFKLFNRLMQSSEPELAEAQAQLHDITRKTAEQIHATLRELDHTSMLNSANFILGVMNNGLQLLVDVLEASGDGDDDDNGDGKYPFQLIRGHSKKDPGASSKDYEVLG